MISTIRKSAAAGLILLVPLAAVILFVWWIYRRAVSLLGPELLQITGQNAIDALINISLILGVAALVIILTGFFAKTFIGRKLEKSLDQLFKKLPLLGTVYDLAKTTSKDVLKEKRFKEPVRVYTGNIRRPAFRTGNKTEDGREVLFMPTSPNITSGFVIEVDPEDIEETDETVDEVLEKLFSAGFGGHEK